MLLLIRKGCICLSRKLLAHLFWRKSKKIDCTFSLYMLLTKVKKDGERWHFFVISMWSTTANLQFGGENLKKDLIEVISKSQNGYIKLFYQLISSFDWLKKCAKKQNLHYLFKKIKLLTFFLKKYSKYYTMQALVGPTNLTIFLLIGRMTSTLI